MHADVAGETVGGKTIGAQPTSPKKTTVTVNAGCETLRSLICIIIFILSFNFNNNATI